ncbi:hypothetical protein SAMN05216315_11716 [Nitrosospira sp. Nsp18]|nr:hypothetical protein SAMN05216315_11716 [Nitrosospira sp. Nsp18]
MTVDIGFGKCLKGGENGDANERFLSENRQNRGVSGEMEGAISAAHCAFNELHQISRRKIVTVTAQRFLGKESVLNACQPG